MPSGEPDMISPELRFVLLCGAGDWAVDRLDSLARSDLDWGAVVALAARQGATGVLGRRVASLEGAGIQEEVRSSLRSLGSIQDFRMVMLEERLREFVSSAADLGVPLLLLKGAAQAIGSEGGFQDRPMADVDILVKSEDAEDLQRLARGMNWVLPEDGYPEENYVDMHHLPPLEAGDGLGFGLELHTDLFPRWNPFAFSAAEVWNEADIVAVTGANGESCAVHVPSVEHQLLHACLHFAWSHGFGRGVWQLVRDVDQLLDDDRLDFDRFVRTAIEARGATCVYWTLSAVQALSGKALPEGLMADLDCEPPALLRKPILRFIVREAMRGPAAPGTHRLRHLLWRMAVRPGRSGHGTARPWTGGERWEERMPLPPEGAEGMDLASRGPRRSPAGPDASLPRRVGESFRYLRWLLGYRPANGG